MNSRDIGRAFAAAAALEPAQRLFTDRTSEQSVFDASLVWYENELCALRSGDWSEQDLHRPRRNVLTFFGVGGIGKSTLMRVLYDRVSARENQLT